MHLQGVRLLFVARTGFEPVICWMRTNCPRPLDERAVSFDFLPTIQYSLSYKALYFLPIDRSLFFMQTKILLTQEGYDKLNLELRQLKETKRKKAIDRLKKAREMGDLSENSEYVAAKEELSFIESRILEIEDKLKKVQVTNHDSTAQKVEIGSRVIVESEGKKEAYMIVGDLETDIAAGKLAYTSPLGKALMRRKTNEEFAVKAPVGLITYKIISIQ